MKKNLLVYISLLVITALLAACNSATPTPAPAAATTAVVSTESQPTETAATAVPQAASPCPVGTWALTDFSTYMLSLQQNLTTLTQNEYSFSNNSYSGLATFVFNDDHTASFSGDNFNQSMTMSANMSGTALEIPMTISINGTSTAKYSIDGDKISYTDQDAGNLVVNVDVMGSASTLDQGMLGQPGTVQLYQFACPDPNTLTLKVIAVQDMDLAPLTLTRVQ
jgi:hypothetical protein